jgi:hypothetical protein
MLTYANVRYRLLAGKDLTAEQMHIKITQLEDRLNVKKEQLLEKELILEEVHIRQLKARNHQQLLEQELMLEDTIALYYIFNACI